jgi:hypothetical protein
MLALAALVLGCSSIKTGDLVQTKSVATAYRSLSAVLNVFTLNDTDERLRQFDKALETGEATIVKAAERALVVDGSSVKNYAQIRVESTGELVWVETAHLERVR